MTFIQIRRESFSHGVCNHKLCANMLYNNFTISNILLGARAWTPTMPPNWPEQVRIWFGHLVEHLVSVLFPVNTRVRIGIRQAQEHRAVTTVAAVPSVR